MKKILTYSILPVLLLTVFSACSKKDNTVAVPATTSSIIVQGTWRVTYFNDNGTNGTANYNGFAFSFTAAGMVTAANSLLSINGTWSSYNDDSQNKLFLNFPSTLSTIAALDHNWHITGKTSIKLVMEDISGAGGGTAFLTIEKN
jgi:hypothetical protein